MPTKKFENLPADKKNIIIEVCMDEFATYGYDNASTNRMVEKIGIAKGSLFEYFPTKKLLFLYIFRFTFDKIYIALNDIDFSSMSTDLIDRIKTLIDVSFQIYIRNPTLYRFQTGIIEKGKVPFLEEIYSELKNKYTDFYAKMFVGVNRDNLAMDIQSSFAVLSLVIEGVKFDFFNEMPHNMKIGNFYGNLYKKFDLAFDILRNGLYK